MELIFIEKHFISVHMNVSHKITAIKKNKIFCQSKNLFHSITSFSVLWNNHHFKLMCVITNEL